MVSIDSQVGENWPLENHYKSVIDRPCRVTSCEVSYEVVINFAEFPL